MPEFSVPDPDTLALGLIVCGAAFVCGGLVFLLPRERKNRAQDRSFEQNIEELDEHLRQMRSEPRRVSD